MIETTQAYKDAIKNFDRQFASKIEVYFDGKESAPVTFTDANLFDFVLLEEMSKQSDFPIGLVSSNTFEMLLDNSERLFSPNNEESPYYNKLLPNIQVKPFLGLEVGLDEEEEPIIEYIPLGVFYTEDWIAPGAALHASVMCHDATTVLFNRSTPQLPVVENISFYNLFKTIFTAIGLTEEDYIIDERLKELTAMYGWFENVSLLNTLQKLAQGACCSIFIGRDEKVNVVSYFTTFEPSTVLEDSDQLVVSDMPQKYLDVYSKVIVRYNMPQLTQQEQILQLSEVNITTDGIVIDRVPFSKGPIAAIDKIILSNSNIIIEDIRYGAWDCSFYLKSIGSTVKTSITVYGRPIQNVTSSVDSTNNELATKIGNKEIVFSPYLLQDKTTALEYATLLLALTSDPAAQIHAESIGDPAIELTDTLLLNNSSHAMPNIETVIYKHRIQYNGGLTASIEGVKRATRTIKDWTYVSPGLYIQTQRV